MSKMSHSQAHARTHTHTHTHIPAVQATNLVVHELIAVLVEDEVAVATLAVLVKIALAVDVKLIELAHRNAAVPPVPKSV